MTNTLTFHFQQTKAVTENGVWRAEDGGRLGQTDYIEGQETQWGHGYVHYLDFGDDSACVHTQRGFPGGSDGKESACKGETWVQSLGQEDTLKKGMATHSNTLAWRIPWREEPGGL